MSSNFGARCQGDENQGSVTNKLLRQQGCKNDFIFSNLQHCCSCGQKEEQAPAQLYDLGWWALKLTGGESW